MSEKLPNKNELEECFFKEVRANNIKKVLDLLNQGVSIDSRDEKNFGKTALHYAAESNFKDLFQKLMTYNPDINIEDNNGEIPLETAVLYDDFEIAKSLIKNGSRLPDRIRDMYPEYFC